MKRLMGLLPATCMAVSIVVLAAPTHGQSAEALSLPACTITGTSRSDTLRGTNGNDVICGLGGNDLILGRGGNDLLLGGPGADVLDGGGGDDTLDGSTGADRLLGGPGADSLVAGDGNDRLEAGAGNDALAGGTGNDSLNGGLGNDRLSGDQGADVLVPGGGIDVCQAGDRVQGSCSIDRSGPAIANFSAPTVVQSGQSVTFTWRLVDPAGIQFAGVTIGWASGIYTGCGFGKAATLVSGTTTDGQWSYTCEFAADAVATGYSAQVVATDNFGNASFSNWSEFRIDGPNADASPPAYADIRLDRPARIGEELTITWRGTDSTGIAGAIMWVAGPGGYRFVDDASRPFAEYPASIGRSCNTEGTSCEFTQTVRLSLTAQPGTWMLWISATDTNGNKVLEQALAFPVVAP